MTKKTDKTGLIEFRLPSHQIEQLKAIASDHKLHSPNTMARFLIQEALKKPTKDYIEDALQTIHQTQLSANDELEMIFQFMHYFVSIFFTLHPDPEKNIASYIVQGEQKRDHAFSRFLESVYKKNTPLLNRIIARKEEE
jgi:hypothetical protein